MFTYIKTKIISSAKLNEQQQADEIKKAEDKLERANKFFSEMNTMFEKFSDLFKD